MITSVSESQDEHWREMPCLEWHGARDRDGYGRTGTAQLAHRNTWEECFGPIPSGMGVLHHCDNPPCRQPLHLFLGGQRENLQDASRKGRLQHTHCKNGHPLEGANLYHHVRKVCGTCARTYQAKRRVEQGMAVRPRGPRAKVRL